MAIVAAKAIDARIVLKWIISGLKLENLQPDFLLSTRWCATIETCESAHCDRGGWDPRKSDGQNGGNNKHKFHFCAFWGPDAQKYGTRFGNDDSIPQMVERVQKNDGKFRHRGKVITMQHFSVPKARMRPHFSRVDPIQPSGRRSITMQFGPVSMPGASCAASAVWAAFPVRASPPPLPPPPFQKGHPHM